MDPLEPRKLGRPRLPTPERQRNRLASKAKWRRENREEINKRKRIHRIPEVQEDLPREQYNTLASFMDSPRIQYTRVERVPYQALAFQEQFVRETIDSLANDLDQMEQSIALTAEVNDECKHDESYDPHLQQKMHLFQEYLEHLREGARSLKNIQRRRE